MAETPIDEEVKWNNDPEWDKLVRSYFPIINKISKNYDPDDHTREDCEQVARWRLYCKYPHECKAYPLFKEGTITEAQFKRELDKYLRTSVRNAILNHIRQDNLYRTRSRTKRDAESGEVTKTYKPAWFTSLDQLVEMGADVSDTGDITWPKITHTGTWDSGGFPGAAYGSFTDDVSDIEGYNEQD
jgi:hypothetical protein